MSFYRETRQQRPWKAKRCRWCDEVCKPGEPRVAVAGMWEGDFFTDHFHTECNEACKKWVWELSDGEFPEEIMQRGGLLTKEEAEYQKIELIKTNNK